MIRTKDLRWISLIPALLLVLSAPTIVFAAGEEASVQSGLSSDMIWELRVEVNADATEAKWSSKVPMGDRVLYVSKGTLRMTAE